MFSVTTFNLYLYIIYLFLLLSLVPAVHDEDNVGVPVIGEGGAEEVPEGGAPPTLHP